MGGWDGEGGKSLVRKIVIKDDSYFSDETVTAWIQE